MTLYCDTCPTGLAFWFPTGKLGFQYKWVDEDPGIFYLEALTVVSAAFFATSRSPKPFHIAIFTDNENTVNLFNTLHAQPLYNPLALTFANLCINHSTSIRVFHIPGDFNIVADALSRFKNHLASNAAPGLVILPFQPPRLTLGASKKWPHHYRHPNDSLACHGRKISCCTNVLWLLAPLWSLAPPSPTLLPSSLTSPSAKHTSSLLIPPLTPSVFIQSTCVPTSNHRALRPTCLASVPVWSLFFQTFVTTKSIALLLNALPAAKKCILPAQHENCAPPLLTGPNTVHRFPLPLP